MPRCANREIHKRSKRSAIDISRAIHVEWKATVSDRMDVAWCRRPSFPFFFDLFLNWTLQRQLEMRQAFFCCFNVDVREEEPESEKKRGKSNSQKTGHRAFYKSFCLNGFQDPPIQILLSFPKFGLCTWKSLLSRVCEELVFNVFRKSLTPLESFGIKLKTPTNSWGSKDWIINKFYEKFMEFMWNPFF